MLEFGYTIPSDATHMQYATWRESLLNAMYDMYGNIREI
jgi:hypothetical protein